MRQERRPGHNVHGQTWPNHQKTAPQGGQYPNASTGGAFNNSVAAPAQHAMCGRNETVFNNTPWTAGLPTTPHIMRRESRDGTNSHLMYGDGNLNGQNMMGKEVAYNFGGLPDWQLSATDELQQRVNNFGGSETGTLPSSSPPSFFSTPPDHGPAFRNGELTDERSRSEMRRHFVPVRQEDVKESEPPLQSRLPAVGFDRGQVQQLDMRNQGIMPSFNQNQVLWLADFSGQASLPYYSSSQVPSLSYRQNTTDNASSSYSAADSDLTYLSQRSDAQRDGSTQDQYHTGKTAEDQAQRKEDDRILMEGKAQGLTYKQIRANLKNPVAESTLRGRYRSLVKPRNQRVRKPIWKEKDVSCSDASLDCSYTDLCNRWSC
jgi:hypothetical protein